MQNLPGELQWINGGAVYGRNGKRPKVIKIYTGQEVVVGYDHQHLEGTWPVEEKEILVIVIVT